MHLDGDEWNKAFDSFTQDAWRFEAQPTYTMPQEAKSLARFLRGEAKPRDHNSRWHERVGAYVTSGRRIGRVRIVRQPLTDYQRYQFAWGIPGNIEAGEDIRVLDVTSQDYGLPLGGTITAICGPVRNSGSTGKACAVPHTPNRPRPAADPS
jgi:uncharacterized protein DUF6879